MWKTSFTQDLQQASQTLSQAVSDAENIQWRRNQTIVVSSEQLNLSNMCCEATMCFEIDAHARSFYSCTTL
jgi:Fe-S cluster biosynthesis and repair protein YggX